MSKESVRIAMAKIKPNDFAVNTNAKQLLLALLEDELASRLSEKGVKEMKLLNDAVLIVDRSRKRCIFELITDFTTKRYDFAQFYEKVRYAGQQKMEEFLQFLNKTMF